MAELQSITNLFNSTLYRIPDYQRGFAWQREQLQDFWFDLINLDTNRKHYTGVLTLKQIPDTEIENDSNERWLIDNSYTLYFVIDGQQRLTTCIILLQCIIESVRKLPENEGKQDSEIVFCNMRLDKYVQTFLFEQSADGVITTYKFGYEKDNPSYKYFRYKILNEPNAGTIDETYYTLNLQNAKVFFHEQLNNLIAESGYNIQPLESTFKKLTSGLQFNPWKIPPSFDEFVAFETMNNRGKKLSNLELLKNRLIFLHTLYTEEEANAAVKKELRDAINEAWTQVYHQLGRNKKHPLNDDDFLRAHWIMYFRYTRKKGDDYVKFLLGNQFTASRVLKKKAVRVELEEVEEILEGQEDYREAEEREEPEERTELKPDLLPEEIKNYVDSLKSAALAWYQTWFPLESPELNNELAKWLDKLNRLPIFYCRPLVMSLLLKNQYSDVQKLEILKSIERYLFITFRLNKTYSNSGSSEFYNASRNLYHDEINIDELKIEVDRQLWFYFDNGKLKFAHFKQLIKERFEGKRKDGFYGWTGIEYFLYEYELHLMKSRGTPKIHWHLFTKSEKDKSSIEHIFPQTPSVSYWKKRFNKYSADEKLWLSNSLGNLLPLSLSINSSLQNDSFDDKKKIKTDNKGNTTRNGYDNGSYSEIEVSKVAEWTGEEIKVRGLKLLKFLEERWNVSLGSKKDKLELLHLEFVSTDSKL